MLRVSNKYEYTGTIVLTKYLRILPTNHKLIQGREGRWGSGLSRTDVNKYASQTQVYIHIIHKYFCTP